jgi:hypothetical protein
MEGISDLGCNRSVGSGHFTAAWHDSATDPGRAGRQSWGECALAETRRRVPTSARRNDAMGIAGERGSRPPGSMFNQEAL